MDKTKTTTTVDIELDAKTRLPIRVTQTVSAGYNSRGTAKAARHVVFKTVYNLSSFGKVEPFSIPAAAAKIIR